MFKIEHSKPLYNETHDLVGFSYNNDKLIHYLDDNSLVVDFDIFSQLDCLNKKDVLLKLNSSLGTDFKTLEIKDSDKILKLFLNTKNTHHNGIINFTYHNDGSETLFFRYDKNNKKLDVSLQVWLPLSILFSHNFDISLLIKTVAEEYLGHELLTVQSFRDENEF